MASYFKTIAFLLLTIAVTMMTSAPVSSEEDDSSNSTEIDNNEDGNSTELYVIRAVVYEVGILTNEENTTDDSEETHEKVEMTFYDPQHNGSMIDLSNIPLPLQTNVSGQVMAAVAPVNLGTLLLPDGTDSNNSSEAAFSPAPGVALPQGLVGVTANVSTTDQVEGSALLQGLPPLLGLQHR